MSTPGELDGYCKHVLKELETLRVVVECKGVVRAARKLRISAGGVSRRIASLEKFLTAQFGTSGRVLEDKRGGVPTPMGQKLLELADSVLNQVESFRETLKTWTSDENLRVATITSIWTAESRELIAQYQMRVPGGNLVPRFIDNSIKMEPFVREGEVDLGILSYPLDTLDPALEHLPWHMEPLVLAASASNVRFTDLVIAEPQHFQRHACFLMLQKHFRMSEEIRKYLEKHQTRVPRIEYFPSIADIKEQVMNDVGISILPEPSIRAELRTGVLCATPLAHPLHRPVGILFRKDGRSRPALARLIDCFVASQSMLPRNLPKRQTLVSSS